MLGGTRTHNQLFDNDLSAYRALKPVKNRKPCLRRLLCQLSYKHSVDIRGLEPRTLRLSGVRSDQLSYMSLPTEYRERIELSKSIVLQTSALTIRPPILAYVVEVEPIYFVVYSRSSWTSIYRVGYGFPVSRCLRSGRTPLQPDRRLPY